MSTEKNDKKSDNSISPVNPNPDAENIIQKDSGNKNEETAKPNPDAENVINHERDEGQENK